MAKILVVDDNEDVLYTVTQIILKKTCHKVITAKDGLDAIKKAEKELPDLILLDINMPEMDGFETCNRLKNNPVTKDIPVIFLTATLQDLKSRIKGLELGADDFLCQPIGNLELLARIKVFLRIKDMADRIKKQNEELELQVSERTAKIIKSENRLKLLIYNARDGIICFTQEGKINIWNQEAENIFGHSFEETKNLVIKQIIPELSLDYLDNAVKEKPETWKPGREIRGIRKNGTNLLLEVTFSYSKEGMATADFTVIVRDITRKKENEDRQRHAEKLTTIGELVSGVAHELNNPLTGILLTTEMLLEEEFNDNHRKMILNMQQQANRAAHIVRDLLTFARKDARDKNTLNVSDILESSLSLVRHQFDTGGISIKMNYGSEKPFYVNGNEHQLQQVILNLLNNAYHAITDSQTGNEVIIETKQIGDKILISISNNGPSIPEKIMNQIFNPFFSTKDKGIGTGLGLSISSGIISEHGGNFSSENLADNSGVVFHIKLPASKEVRAGDIGKASEERKTKISSKNILIVDDEDYIRDLLSKILTKMGHECENVESGDKGLKELNKNSYDLVISDFTMPGINGIEFYQQAIVLNKYLKEKFIFISGMIDDTIKTYTEDTGTYYIQKPFSKKDVVKIIEQVFQEETG